ncbi:hypothetical protein ES319_A01G073700v1, partial [Gossypium barbadense]
ITNEKVEGVIKEERRMEDFRKALADCDLVDMGFSRPWFTWERGNLAETNIMEKLDRGVANVEWMNLFSKFSISHLPHYFSDHCLLIQTDQGERWI